MQKNKGFTLSEVLITLGVIGVIAAIIIPTLLNYYGKADSYSKLNKSISVVSDIAATIRRENGSDFTNLITSSTVFANLFRPYLKALKYCNDASDSEGCYIANTDQVYTLDGRPFGGATTNYYFHASPKILTADGFVYWFEINTANCTTARYLRDGVGETCGTVYVDTNGVKPPNTFGKDIFAILVNKYNVTTYGTGGGCSTTDTTTVWNGIQCSGCAILRGKIDYY